MEAIELSMSEANEIDMTISSIWREERVSCPQRKTIQDFVAGKLTIEEADYLRFHILEIGCPYCQASEEDLRMKSSNAAGEEKVRDRLFEATTKFLQKQKRK